MYTHLYHVTCNYFMFRMKPSTFEFILKRIGEQLCYNTGGNVMIAADKQLLLSSNTLQFQIHTDKHVVIRSM